MTLLADRPIRRREEHLALHGDLPRIHRGRLLAELDESGLAGRGGAGFPTARKIRAVAGRRRAIVVANGTEGEPESAKDEVLLEVSPHLVVDGVLVATRLVGAREAAIAVGRGATGAHDALVEALADRPDAGAIRVVDVPDRFVAGEESALVNYVGGGEARPTITPPRPAERGVRGRPTLVQNVETLAALALLARRGADRFRAEETHLATVRGAVRRPGVVEVRPTVTFGELFAAVGGTTAPLQAVLVGGYFGTWLPAGRALAAPLSESGLAPLDASPGARAVVALPSASCGVLETARVAWWLARESAGQCGPCVHGLAAVAGDLGRIARREDCVDAHSSLVRRLQAIEGRGACRHPDGAVRFVASALRAFADEVDLHLHGRCTGLAERPVLPLPLRRHRGGR